MISSRSDPTVQADEEIMARTPSDLSPAMLARAGMDEGEIVCPGPCRATKATRVPEGSETIVIGLEG